LELDFNPAPRDPKFQFLYLKTFQIFFSSTKDCYCVVRNQYKGRRRRILVATTFCLGWAFLCFPRAGPSVLSVRFLSAYSFIEFRSSNQPHFNLTTWVRCLETVAASGFRDRFPICRSWRWFPGSCEIVLYSFHSTANNMFLPFWFFPRQVICKRVSSVACPISTPASWVCSSRT
jgi:hypothetical protein